MPTFGAKSTGVQSNDSEKEGIDYIKYDGEKYTEFIEGPNGRNYPEIPERIEVAEKAQFAISGNSLVKQAIGDSFYSSNADRNKDSENFPNPAIGQDEDGNLHLENAISPMHYWYALIFGGKPAYGFKDEFESEYEDADFPADLEVYRANYPTRKMEWNGEMVEFVEIEVNSPYKSGKMQVPPEWENGLPEIQMEEIEQEPEKPENENENAEWDGQYFIPDDVWEDCNTDADRIRAILDHNEGFVNLEKSDKVENLLEFEHIDSSKSNIYATLKDWNESNPDSTKTSGDTVEIPKDELEQLREKAEKYDNIQENLA